MSHSDNNVKYSIVVPVFNEEKNVSLMYQKLIEVMGKESFEVIFVDDGSRDDTFVEIDRLARMDERIRGLHFARNFGHQLALTAGYDACRGQAVICLDGDLQHPPEMIPEMIAKWKEGYDIVLTIREDAEDTSFFKSFTSKMFYNVINKMSQVDIIPGSADFRLLDRKAVDAFKSFRERNRFIRGMVSWMGFKVTCLNYKANERIHGKSKYSLKKMFRFAADGILSFSSYPLKLSSVLGYCISGFAFIYIIYALMAKLLFNTTTQGWTSILIAVLFLGGVQLICIGIIGEYISRIYDETKNRPLYIIDREAGEKERDE